MLYICTVKQKTMKNNLTKTQLLWIKKMVQEYGMTEAQAINYLFYNA